MDRESFINAILLGTPLVKRDERGEYTMISTDIYDDRDESATLEAIRLEHVPPNVLSTIDDVDLLDYVDQLADEPANLTPMSVSYTGGELPEGYGHTLEEFIESLGIDLDDDWDYASDVRRRMCEEDPSRKRAAELFKAIKGLDTPFLAVGPDEETGRYTIVTQDGEGFRWQERNGITVPAIDTLTMDPSQLEALVELTRRDKEYLQDATDWRMKHMVPQVDETFEGIERGDLLLSEWSRGLKALCDQLVEHGGETRTADELEQAADGPVRAMAAQVVLVAAEKGLATEKVWRGDPRVWERATQEERAQLMFDSLWTYAGARNALDVALTARDQDLSDSIRRHGSSHIMSSAKDFPHISALYAAMEGTALARHAEKLLENNVIPLYVDRHDIHIGKETYDRFRETKDADLALLPSSYVPARAALAALPRAAEHPERVEMVELSRLVDNPPVKDGVEVNLAWALYKMEDVYTHPVYENPRLKNKDLDYVAAFVGPGLGVIPELSGDRGDVVHGWIAVAERPFPVFANCDPSKLLPNRTETPPVIAGDDIMDMMASHGATSHEIDMALMSGNLRREMVEMARNGQTGYEDAIMAATGLIEAVRGNPMVVPADDVEFGASWYKHRSGYDVLRDVNGMPLVSVDTFDRVAWTPAGDQHPVEYDEDLHAYAERLARIELGLPPEPDDEPRQDLTAAEARWETPDMEPVYADGHGELGD